MNSNCMDCRVAYAPRNDEGLLSSRALRGNPGLRWLAVGVLSAAAWHAQAATPQEVSLTSLDGTPLKAWVFQPDKRPRATVVALHGCGGLYATLGSRKGQLNARHQAMADRLVGQGYAVVFPDSLTPRGVAQLCRQKLGERRIHQRERRRDALATLNWVGAQPWADANRIALLGWSHGGSAVLSATDAKQAEVASQVVKPALAIAFYPGCASSLQSGYLPTTPLFMLLGALDDWTPPGPCIELGKAVGAQVQVYPGSYHGFDNPVGSVQLLADIPNGVNPGQGVHAGPNPAARDAANARVLEVLAAAFD